MTALLAPAAAAHVAFHVARYRGAHDDEGRAWITWDGVQIASFETLPWLMRIYPLTDELKELGLSPDDASDQAVTTANNEGLFGHVQFR